MNSIPTPHQRLAPPDERLHRLDVKFAVAVGDIHQRLLALVGCEPFIYNAKPRRLPSRVIYLFSEGDRPLYVGRSKRFTQRLGNHCRQSSKENQSSFAFQLAREESGILAATYSGAHTRRNLMKLEEFAAGFLRAKVRLNAMDIRYVEESDPVKQALLEIYCAVALGTPYNDFDTH